MSTEETGSPCGDESASASGSPRNRIKFLCSYGGKIMLRPSDGQFKYVGGETRVIAVPRDVTFSELMKRLTTEFEGETVLKYQIVPDDLELLVTVRTDSDLKYMLDEYFRHETEGTLKLRTFLFPINQRPSESRQTSSPVGSHEREQNYFEALNGIRGSSSSGKFTRISSINSTRPVFSISACSSPKTSSPPKGGSPEKNWVEPNTIYEYNFAGGKPLSSMQKVRSSPNICSLNGSVHQCNSSSSNHQLYHHQQYHAHYQQPQQQYQQPMQHYPAYQLSRAPHELYRISSFGQYEMGYQHQHQHQPSRYGPSFSRQSSGNSTKYGYYDDQPQSVQYYRNADRYDGIPSPRSTIFE